MADNGVGIFAGVIFLLCAVHNANSYSKYGRGCQDIACLPNEECVITQDPCIYNQREGNDCGSYPTCKRKKGGSSFSSGPVNPSGTNQRNGFEGNVFAIPSDSSSSSQSSSSSFSNTQTNYNHNGNDNGLRSPTMNGADNNNNHNNNGNHQNGGSNNNQPKNNNGNGQRSGLAPIDPHYIFGAPYFAPNIPDLPIFPYNAPTQYPSFQQFPQSHHPGSSSNQGLQPGGNPGKSYNPSAVFGHQPFYPAPSGVLPGNSGGSMAGIYALGGYSNPNMYNKPPPQYQSQNSNGNTNNRESKSNRRYSPVSSASGLVASGGAVLVFGCVATVLNTLLQQQIFYRQSR